MCCVLHYLQHALNMRARTPYKSITTFRKHTTPTLTIPSNEHPYISFCNLAVYIRVDETTESIAFRHATEYVAYI